MALPNSQHIDASNKSDKQSTCSEFFLTNIFLSAVNGWRNRKKQESDAQNEKDFQNHLTEIKNDFEDFKEILESDFRTRLSSQKNEYHEIRSNLKLDFDSEKDELKMFIKGWPLKLSLQAVQKRRESKSTLPASLTVVIGRHSDIIKGDPLAKTYDGDKGIVSEIIGKAGAIGISEEDVLRFKSEYSFSGGVALANIYAMMGELPTVVILPQVDRVFNNLIISIGYWYSNIHNPIQRKIFELDYDESRMQNDKDYLKTTLKRIVNSYLAIVGVINDTYRLWARNESPLYLKYIIDNERLNEHTYIKEFIKTEYQSIIESDPKYLQLNSSSPANQDTFERVSNFFDRGKIKCLKTEIKCLLDKIS